MTERARTRAEREARNERVLDLWALPDRLTIEVISDRTGIPVRTIKGVVGEARLSGDPRTLGRRPGRAMTPWNPKDEAVMALWGAGLAVQEIARRHSIEPRAVERIVQRAKYRDDPRAEARGLIMGSAPAAAPAKPSRPLLVPGFGIEAQPWQWRSWDRRNSPRVTLVRIRGLE